jgi:tetratricopeptide (TPR) repeat protein
MERVHAISVSVSIIFLCLAAAFLLSPPAASAGSLDISVPLLIDLSEVMPFLEKSSGKASKDAGLHTALGGIYINLGVVDPKRESGPDYDPPEFAMAEGHLRKAVALAPKRALPHYYLGLLEMHRQDRDKALEHMKEALALNPKDVRVHQQIHTIYFSAEKYATSALFLEESVKILTREADLYHRLAISYLSIRRFSRAGTYAKKAMKLEYDPETHNLLATIHLKKGSSKVAEEEFRKVLKGHPENINAMLGLARTYGLRGESRKAMRWLGEVFAIDAENEEARVLLEEIQAARRQEKQ